MKTFTQSAKTIVIIATLLISGAIVVPATTFAWDTNFGGGCCNSSSGNNMGNSLGTGDGDHYTTTSYPRPVTTVVPSCTLSANPSSITNGYNTTLTWNSSNAVSATLNQSIGNVSVSGSRSVSPSSSLTYTLTVTSSTGNTATCGTTVTVTQVNTHPTCDVSVSDSSIAYGDDVVVSWSSSRATSMYISGIGTVAENTSGSRTISNLTSDRTFTCTARDDDGDEDTDTVTVDVGSHNNSTPTCDVRVSDSSVDEGDDVTLYWESDNATSMYISGVGYVDANDSGSKRFYDLSDDRTFTCTAKDDDGDKDTDTVTVRVSNTSSNTRPTCDLRISDTSIDRGDSVTLYWESDDATSMYITNVGYVDENESDSKRIYNITRDTTFTCTARDSDGNKDTDTVTVRVGGSSNSNLPTCEISASNNSVAYGGNTTISWDTNDGDYATLTSVGAVSLDGSQTFYSLRTSQTYVLAVTNDAGTRTCNTTVYVAPHISTPTPTYSAPTYTAPVVTYTAPQVTYTAPKHQVALSHVPYTGAEDYIYPGFLFALVLTAGYALYNRRSLLGIA